MHQLAPQRLRPVTLSVLAALAFVSTACGADEAAGGDSPPLASDLGPLFPDASAPSDGLNADAALVDGTFPEDLGSDDPTAPDASPGDAQPGSDLAPTDAVLPSDAADTAAPSRGLVRIAAPLADATVSGPVTIVLEPDDRDERLVDAVRLKVNGVVVATDTKLPTRFVLDTRTVDAFALELVAEAEDGAERGFDATTVLADNPSVRFISASVDAREARDGQIVNITARVDAPGTVTLGADFSALDTGFDPSRVFSAPLGGGEYAISYVITPTNAAPDGDHPIPLTATLGTEVVPFTGLTLRLRNGAIDGVSIPNGFHVGGPAPEATAGWTVAAPALSATNTSVVTGGTTNVRANIAGLPAADRVVGLLVSVAGQEGHFQVPVDPTAPPADGLVAATIRVRQDYFASVATLPPVNLRVALRDARGRVSPAATMALTVLRVGSGDLQFSLNWSTRADLDLHVVDPLACRTYFSNKNCLGSGGRLDLDSNVACRAGPGIENVFFQAGTAPPGLYEAFIVPYNDTCCAATGCTTGHPYTLTINYCGRTETRSGLLPYLNRSSVPFAEAISVARVDNRSCDRTAAGRVRYEDRPLAARGFGDSRWQAVAGAVVELRELGTNAVLATGVTDARGDYLLRFATEAPGYVVAVRTETSTDEGLRRIKVMNHPKFKRVYEAVSGPVLLPSEVDAVSIRDLDIPAERFAGAFNIFDVLRASWDDLRRATGRNPPDLRVFWATGSDTTDTRYCSRAHADLGACTELGAVSVNGRDEDRDEYDDMIIAREFYKFALDTLARDNHPGGASDGRRDTPSRSWTDGVTAALAASLLGSEAFVDSRPLGIYVVDDLEAMPTPFGLREVAGDHSRYLVMALVHDLIDAANEDWDAVANARSAVLDVLFTHLSGGGWTDRGPAGVDLTDLLDGWLCRGWAERPALEALVARVAFGYDFGGPTGCWP